MDWYQQCGGTYHSIFWAEEEYTELRCVTSHEMVVFIYLYFIQGVSRLYGITAGGDFLGFCDQKSSYKHVSDFGQLRSYGRFLIPVHVLV